MILHWFLCVACMLYVGQRYEALKKLENFAGAVLQLVATAEAALPGVPAQQRRRRHPGGPAACHGGHHAAAKDLQPRRPPAPHRAAGACFFRVCSTRFSGLQMAQRCDWFLGACRRVMMWSMAHWSAAASCRWPCRCDVITACVQALHLPLQEHCSSVLFLASLYYATCV